MSQKNRALVAEAGVEKLSIGNALSQKLRDYGVLMKFKLSVTVVFSAVMAYMIALKSSLNLQSLLVLAVGGLCVTGAANALNEVLEKDYDRMMKRTENRPLATGRMTVSEAVLFAGLMNLVGISLLAMFNPMTAFLAMVSFISYAFVYTPMKRVSNVAVTIGAIPGALPMAIGCAAAQGGTLTVLAFTLFALQFLWQFPHFWAIAWLAHEDYSAAGFKLLPTKDGVKDKNTGWQAFIFAMFLIPVGSVLYFTGIIGLIPLILLSAVAAGYAYFGWQLFRFCSREAARKLMFYSFFYLPAILGIIYFGKY